MCDGGEVMASGEVHMDYLTFNLFASTTGKKMGTEVKARRRKAEQLPRVTGEREDVLTNWQRGKRVRQRQRETEASGDWQRQRDREVQTVTDRVKEWDEERERDVKTVWHLLSWHRCHHTVSQAAVICTWLKVLNMSIHKGPISRSLDDNNSLNLPDLIYNKLNSLWKT